MIEVFKTNVADGSQAHCLVERLHNTFAGYKANFDLEDCDKILRIACEGNRIEVSRVINLLKDSGVYAEVLPDHIPPVPSVSKIHAQYTRKIRQIN